MDSIEVLQLAYVLCVSLLFLTRSRGQRFFFRFQHDGEGAFCGDFVDHVEV